MSTPTSDLGLSCPSKGKFYVCENAAIRFVGCCTVDPCADGSGRCPKKALAPASFSSDHYDSIPAQNCAAPSNSDHWFTCQSSQPFIGCCKVNPCEHNGCPTASLLAATLSDDPANAQVFLSGPSSSATPDSSESSGESLPIGAIVGIAIGCTAFIAIILAFLAYRCGWLARHRKHEKESGEAAKHASTQSGYAPSSYAPSEAQWQEGTHSGAPSPGFLKPGLSPYSPGQYYHYYAPGIQSSPPPETWQVDNRHVSQMSELSGWDPVAVDREQQAHATLLAPGVTELEGDSTRLSAIAELPSSPNQR
ncbi:hypothetical protein GGR52DRAFT_568839 [Hypoxylon sp. FL1284]|nr:hypothetical protein GGR52DRAFT_568839 [Hypoxylon sp. FL1284]